MLYDFLVKPFVKNQSAEKASKAALRYFRIINSIPGLRPFYRFIHGNKAAGMEREVFGIKFYNPVGLGAGLDLKGELYNDLNSLGFSFVEIGPLNAECTRAAVHNIQQEKPSDVLAACISSDFQACFSLAYDFCDFFTIDVRNPNKLENIVNPLLDIRLTYDDYKPIVIKVPENCPEEELKRIVDYCLLYGIDGICTRSLKQTQYVYKLSDGRLAVIANSHIESEQQAQDLIDSGASLIELRSGLVHKGPSFVRRVIQFLENNVKNNVKRDSKQNQ